MGRPSPPAWLCGRWQVMSRPCHSGMGAQVEATQGGCVLATAGGCGGEGSDVCPHAISQRGWGQHARPRQTSAASWKPKPPASCWPVVRLKVSCCSVSRPATTCISHISCPLLSKLHRAGQHCRRKPPKEGHKEGPWQRHHPSWDTTGCPSPRGQERDRNGVALDAESGCSSKRCIAFM